VLQTPSYLVRSVMEMASVFVLQTRSFLVRSVMETAGVFVLQTRSFLVWSVMETAGVFVLQTRSVVQTVHRGACVVLKSAVLITLRTAEASSR